MPVEDVSTEDVSFCNPGTSGAAGRKPISAERRLGELLESAPDAILEIDNGGRIVFLNRMAEQLFGYTRKELLGQTVEVLVRDSGHLPCHPRQGVRGSRTGRVCRLPGAAYLRSSPSPEGEITGLVSVNAPHRAARPQLLAMFRSESRVRPV
jgi:PAS domain-containing protein